MGALLCFVAGNWRDRHLENVRVLSLKVLPNVVLIGFLCSDNGRLIRVSLFAD